MQSMARGLTAEMREALSIYYSGLQAPAKVNVEVPDAVRPQQRGAWLALRGKWDNDVPGCVQCHGQGVLGVGPHIPPLWGQQASYLRAQLLAWKHQDRPGGPLGLMATIARRLSSADIDDVAAYFANAPESALAGASSSSSAAPLNAVPPSAFRPAEESSIADDDFGREVRKGEALFLHTAELAKQYVGSPINCVSCHLDAGRRADSAPLWGAYTVYPAYRRKTGQVNTFAERIQGCFNYSENGKAPPLGDPVLTALETYAYWMARGAPVGIRLPGTGYPKLAQPPRAPDFDRGALVFEKNCALCHGADGQGQRSEAATVFPALWGELSYNWGAGMEQIDNAAGFIKANMPLGLGGSLSDQDAWDVARFIDSHERPQDPRFTLSTEKTRELFHDAKFSMYGTPIDGHILGSQ